MLQHINNILINTYINGIETYTVYVTCNETLNNVLNFLGTNHYNAKVIEHVRYLS